MGCDTQVDIGSWQLRETLCGRLAGKGLTRRLHGGRSPYQAQGTETLQPLVRALDGMCCGSAKVKKWFEETVRKTK